MNEAMNHCREKFLAWHIPSREKQKVDGSGRYIDDWTQALWTGWAGAWQAAMSTEKGASVLLATLGNEGDSGNKSNTTIAEASDTLIDLSRLKEALKFGEDGFTPWNEEKELFIAAARAYLKMAQREIPEHHCDATWEDMAMLKQEITGLKSQLAQREIPVNGTDEEKYKWMCTQVSPESKAAFMVNWLRGSIYIPEDVQLRIWLMENDKRGLTPNIEDPSPKRESGVDVEEAAKMLSILLPLPLGNPISDRHREAAKAVAQTWRLTTKIEGE